MTSIDLDNMTARQLLDAATAQGMTVNQFVGTYLLPPPLVRHDEKSDALLGSMAEEADLLDEVLSGVHAAREGHPLRLDSDG